MPDGVSLDIAAAVMLQGITAHYLCVSTYPVREGDVTVVHAAAGGVGLLLTQMIKRRGGVVVATTSGGASGEKTAAGPRGGRRPGGRLRDVPRRRWPTSPRTAARTWSTTAWARRRSTTAWPRCARAARWSCTAAASGQVPPFDPQRLNYGGSLYLTRPTMASYIADRDELLGRTRDLFGWIAAGELTVRIGATYPLADAAQAHEDLAARRTTGKLLLRP